MFNLKLCRRHLHHHQWHRNGTKVTIDLPSHHIAQKKMQKNERKKRPYRNQFERQFVRCVRFIVFFLVYAHPRRIIIVHRCSFSKLLFECRSFYMKCVLVFFSFNIIFNNAYTFFCSQYTF